ncbi:MAG: DUF4136 domain-containing protein [Bryobacteraceae bacterium]|jgi:Domain of unknown function (DUF4136)
MKQALTLSISICAAWALTASAQTDYSHGADFSQYKTYSWIGAITGGPNASNDLWAKNIEQDVNRTLGSKGWIKVQAGGDAVVSAFGRTYNDQTLATYYNGVGGDWLWRGLGGGSTDNPAVGTLVVDIFDGKTKKLLWRGSAPDTLVGKPDQSATKLKQSVTDMFKGFPPG